MFFEASTRTRVSFGSAFNLLGGEVRETAGFESSALVKGESLQDTARVLSNLGHHIQRPEKPIGGGQIISVDNAMEVLVGASDPRKDGCALGL